MQYVFFPSCWSFLQVDVDGMDGWASRGWQVRYVGQELLKLELPWVGNTMYRSCTTDAASMYPVPPGQGAPSAGAAGLETWEPADLVGTVQGACHAATHLGRSYL